MDNSNENAKTKYDNIEWKKVLYEKQGVPDHYVPPSFLKDLRKNGKFDIKLTEYLMICLS